MLRVALTGGIGTGKSAVLATLAELGVPVLDADPLAHSVIARGTSGATAVRMRFGDAVMDASGGVDRRRLGELVFRDEAARRDLEAIIHPEVYRTIELWMEANAAQGVPVAVAEIQLLFETGRSGDFGRVVVAACEAETQVQRAMHRSRLAEDEVRRRIAAQMPLDEKVRRADYVIRTDGSLEDTRTRTTVVWRALVQDAQTH